MNHKRSIFIIVILTLYCFFAEGQNERKKWYFGSYAALDFMSNPPSSLSNSAMWSGEGCASVADAGGSLLFYTDGRTIWNQTHQPMANGTNLNGHNSTTQSSLIVKKPGSTNKYFVFTLDQLGSDLYYSEVDMLLANGMGSVTAKNVLLVQTQTERLAGTIHCNGTDVWVLSHSYGNSDFNAFLVTNNGINANPIVSTIGNAQNNNRFAG